MTFEDSCVFHTEQGCALPQEMRSNTCNDYLCKGLHALVDELARREPPQAFLVAAQGQEIQRTAFVEA